MSQRLYIFYQLWSIAGMSHWSPSAMNDVVYWYLLVFNKSCISYLYYCIKHHKFCGLKQDSDSVKHKTGHRWLDPLFKVFLHKASVKVAARTAISWILQGSIPSSLIIVNSLKLYDWSPSLLEIPYYSLLHGPLHNIAVFCSKIKECLLLLPLSQPQSEIILLLFNSKSTDERS